MGQFVFGIQIVQFDNLVGQNSCKIVNSLVANLNNIFIINTYNMHIVVYGNQEFLNSFKWYLLCKYWLQ